MEAVIDSELVVMALRKVLGGALTAYIASIPYVDNLEAVRQGEYPLSPNQEQRLRFAFDIVQDLIQYESFRTIQAWFTGSNPELNDRVVAQLLREAPLDEVRSDILAAKTAFITT